MKRKTQKLNNRNDWQVRGNLAVNTDVHSGCNGMYSHFAPQEFRLPSLPLSIEEKDIQPIGQKAKRQRGNGSSRAPKK